jgi:hypothetical protein
MPEHGTHFTPPSGGRRQRYRKAKVAAAERQSQAVTDAYRAMGELTKFFSARPAKST